MNSTENSELGADKNVIQDELSVDKLYEIFSLQASDLPEIMDTFQVLKRKLDVEKLYGLELYHELKTKLGARNSKTWKAREVLNMLDKRANQKEYMEQVGCALCVCVCACECMCVCAHVCGVSLRGGFVLGHSFALLSLLTRP